MNNLKSLLFLLPGVVLSIAGILLCVNPALKFPGAEKQLRNQENKLTRLIESIGQGKLENQKLSTELKPISAKALLLLLQTVLLFCVSVLIMPQQNPEY